MVVKLAGKCLLFGVLWYTSVNSFLNPKDNSGSVLFGAINFEDPKFLSRVLSVAYFLLASLSFLEVRIAVWVLVSSLLYSIFTYPNLTQLLNDLAIVSGLLLYYSSLTYLRPLNSNKRS